MQLDTQTLIQIFGVIVASGAGVSIIAQVFKKSLAHIGVDSNAVIHTVVLALAAVTAAAQYIEQIHGSLPPVILGISGPAIYGFSQIVFKYASYLNAFLAKVYASDTNPTAQTTTSNETVLPVAVPAEPQF